MGRIIIRKRAEDAVDAIADRIARDNIQAALRFYDRVEETYERITRWPLIGSRIRVRDRDLADLRTYPIRGYRKYIVFYRPMADGIEVVHVIHGARGIRRVLREQG